MSSIKLKCQIVNVLSLEDIRKQLKRKSWHTKCYTVLSRTEPARADQSKAFKESISEPSLISPWYTTCGSLNPREGAPFKTFLFIVIHCGAMWSPQGARDFAHRLTPPPLTDKTGLPPPVPLLPLLEPRNTTITVVSSWKWRRTPRSIFFKSEYRISRFLAASCIAAFTSLLALP